MKTNTVDTDAEVKEYLRAAGIALSDSELELLKRCTDYAERIIDRGANSWPVGLPLNKATAKPAAKITFDDIAATVWKNRRNSFTPKTLGDRNE